jgi:hypothetical protein
MLVRVKKLYILKYSQNQKAVHIHKLLPEVAGALDKLQQETICISEGQMQLNQLPYDVVN